MVVNAVVESVQQAGGRFLKLNKDRMWYVVSQKEAREKTGHALRDAVGLRLKLSSSTDTTTSALKILPGQRRSSNIVMERPQLCVVDEEERRGIFDEGEVEGKCTLRKAKKADQVPDIGTNIVNVNKLGQNIPLTTLQKGSCTTTLEELKDQSTSQKPRKKSDMFDSNDFSVMSVSRDMFDSAAEGLSSEFSAMDVANAAPSASFSVKSEVFDDVDQTAARTVKEVNDRVDMQISEDFMGTKSLSGDHHAANLASPVRTLGKKHATRVSRVDNDICEEFSVTSMSEIKKEWGKGDGDARPKSAKASTAGRFGLLNTEIKPRAGWESEISDEFSTGFANPTGTSWTTTSMSEVSDDASNGRKVVALKTETNRRGRNFFPSTSSSITIDGNHFQALSKDLSSSTFDMKSLEEAIDSPCDVYGVSEDFELKLKASLSSNVECLEEFGMPNPTPIGSPTATAMKRKKILKLLFDVGEDDAEDASLGISKHLEVAANPVYVDKNENKNDGDNSEACSVDTDQEWNKTLKALAS